MIWKARALTTVLGALFASSGIGNAQAFEVATIKPESGRGAMGGGCHGTDSSFGGALGVSPPPAGMCVIRRATLKMLIQEAYGLRGPDADRMVSGGPGWVDSERFDVDAKSAEPTTVAAMSRMLQNLLADRFNLTFHREEKESTGFALVVAKDGPKLTQAPPNEGLKGLQRVNGGPLVAQNASMAQLARTLSILLSRPVEDKTGLSGGYAFTLTWTPDDDQRSFIAMLPPEVRERLPQRAAASGPSIFTALQEQLGLRLESQKSKIEILVIDRAETPSEN